MACFWYRLGDQRGHIASTNATVYSLGNELSDILTEKKASEALFLANIISIHISLPLG